MGAERKKRSEVPVEQTWNLTDLFGSTEEWEEAVTQVQKDVEELLSFKGTLVESADNLSSCLIQFEQIQERMVRVSTYASLQSSGDGSDPVNQSNAARIAAIFASINAKVSFIEAEILACPQETIEQFLEEKEELQPFKKFLFDILEKKPFSLSPDVEETLAALGGLQDSPFMIYQRSKSSDMQFDSITDEDGNELPMSFSAYEERYEFSPNTHIRRSASKSFTNTLNQYKNTFATVYATEVNKQVTLARLRGFDSVTHMLLQPQQVTEEMYYNQLDVIQKELAPHMRRYAKLKQKQLGVEEMRFCDLKVSLDPEFHPDTSYEEATDIIKKALAVMGPEYSAVIERAFDERWIDYAENIGKSTGAFCSSPYGVHPYVLVTWTNTMRGAFLLAHELGHAGHAYFASKHQRLVNTRASRYFIEAPSTMNEMLLADYLLNQPYEDRMKRWVIDQILGTYYHNFVTHLLEGEYQRRVYALAEQGVPITATVLTQQKRETLENFWGDAVVIDEGASLTWMRQPHYYMGLYPYTYSAGLTVSTAVSQQIKKEGQPAIDRWIDVLKTGGTLKPLDLIKKAGVDMSKPDAIQDAVAYVGTLIDDLEKSFS